MLSDSRSYRCTGTYCFKFRLRFLCGMCVHVLSCDRSSRVSILGLETQFECLGLGMQSLDFGLILDLSGLGSWSWKVRTMYETPIFLETGHFL